MHHKEERTRKSRNSLEMSVGPSLVKEVIVMSDLNWNVGTSRTGYEQVIGFQGIGESNAEGKRILYFCVRNNRAITNTYYRHKNAHKWV